MLTGLDYEKVRKKCAELSESYQIDEESFFQVIEHWDDEDASIDKKLEGVFQDLLDKVSGEITSMEKEASIHPTCQMGCAFCCYFPIIITKFEALLMQQAIQQFEPERKEKIYNHIQAYKKKYEEILKQVPEQYTEEVEDVKLEYKKLHLPCVMLETETNQCMAYEVRPIPCRTYMSYSNPRLCKENLLPKETVSFEFLYEPYMSALNEFMQWLYEDGDTGKVTYPDDLYKTDYLFNWMGEELV